MDECAWFLTSDNGSVSGCSIKIENEDLIVEEEYEDDSREEVYERPVVKQEYEYGDTNGEEELQLPMLVTLPDNTFVLKEETLIDPLSDISPISDSWIKQENVLFDAETTSETTGSSIYIQTPARTSWEPDSSHKSYVPFKCQGKYEDYKTIECKNNWIQEAKEKVEKHIQEVRKYRKSRNPSNEVKRIRRSRSEKLTEFKQDCVSKPRTRKSPRFLKPPPVGGQEWVIWVREQKERLEKHILEVRESRKRQYQVLPQPIKKHMVHYETRPEVMNKTKHGNSSEGIHYSPNLVDIAPRKNDNSKEMGLVSWNRIYQTVTISELNKSKKNSVD